ncbi:MAG: alpha/beta hydrolase, partial [Dehalococcoidia bacterium]|nr:alpha/beta hydrolase [Dehalococcoidia bacterium]
LAPENPHPAPVEECYAGLVWTVAHAAELGIDAARLAIGGPSAGSGLAAGTALMARDRGGPAIAFQMLIYPMLDDRNVTPSSHLETAPGVWDRETNVSAWKALLGEAAGTEAASPYAAPARAADFSGLPPAFIDVGTADLFCDEDIAYAQRLMQAGVPTELHVYPGAFHGFDGMAPNARVTIAAKALRTAALQRALHG